MLVIGISGGTGCGKTTVVEQLCASLPDNSVSVLSQDDYYNDLGHLNREERAKVNFDHPDSIDFELMLTHIEELRRGKSIARPCYSFVEETRLEKTVPVQPRSIILVEGILVFHKPELRELFNLKLFIEADDDERLLRRMRRDLRERGHDLDKSIQRYREVVKPMYDTYVYPSRAYADLILPNNDKNPNSIRWISQMLRTEMQTHGIP